MPKKKKTTSENTVRHKKNISTKTVVSNTNLDHKSLSSPESDQSSRKQKGKQNLITVAILLLVLLGFFLYKRGFIVAAIVGGEPIFKWQLTSEVSKKYGTQTLESMITEKILQQEIAKNHINVSEKEIAQREDEFLKQFGGGVKLDDVLSFQGITKDEFDRQVRMQIAVEKIISRDLKITDAEVTNYIATNSAKLESSDSAGLKEEAKEAIIKEYVSEKIEPWFNDLKSRIKINRFIQ